MSELTIYEKSTCSKCRDLVALLDREGIPFERIDYHLNPLSEDQVRELLVKAGIGPREVVRSKEPVYAELGLGDREVTDAELIRLMAVHPQLLERPIVERGDRAVLARPATRVMELFESSET
jgi:arsenate reductase